MKLIFLLNSSKNLSFWGSYILTDLNVIFAYLYVCHGRIRLPMMIVWCALSAFPDIQTSIL